MPFAGTLPYFAEDEAVEAAPASIPAAPVPPTSVSIAAPPRIPSPMAVELAELLFPDVQDVHMDNSVIGKSLLSI